MLDDIKVTYRCHEKGSLLQQFFRRFYLTELWKLISSQLTVSPSLFCALLVSGWNFLTFFSSLSHAEKGSLRPSNEKNLSSAEQYEMFRRLHRISWKLRLCFFFLAAIRNFPLFSEPFSFLPKRFTVNFSYFHIRIDSIKVKWKSDKRIKKIEKKENGNFQLFALVCCWSVSWSFLIFSRHFTHRRCRWSPIDSQIHTQHHSEFSCEKFIFILLHVEFPLSFTLPRWAVCDKEIHHLQMVPIQLSSSTPRRAHLDKLHRHQACRKRREIYRGNMKFWWKLNSSKSISEDAKKFFLKQFSISQEPFPRSTFSAPHSLFKSVVKTWKIENILSPSLRNSFTPFAY